MRKAVQAATARRSRNRKNEDAPGASTSTASSSSSASSSSPAQPPAVTAVQLTNSNPGNSNNSGNNTNIAMIASLADNTRRKATPEEAALTAKNYRLAKELSELRVRHREETRNVNRLTLENMNLASRCREAISHVGMLKKELSTFQHHPQKRLLSHHHDAAITTSSSTGSGGGQKTSKHKEQSTPPRSLQKNSPRPPEPSPLPNMKPHTGRALDVAREMDQMDQLLAKRHDSPRKASRSIRSGSSSAPVDLENVYEAEAEEDVPRTSLFPSTASPKMGRTKNYNEGFPGDITSVHRLNSRQRKGTLGGFVETAEDEPSPSSNAFSISEETTKTGASDQSDSAAIDAFEASFNTKFPDSFSPPTVQPLSNNNVSASTRDEAKSPDRSLAEPSAYNPFSLSPRHVSSPSKRQGGAFDAREPNHNSGKQQLRTHRDPPGKVRTSPRPLQQSGVNTTTAAGAFSPVLVATGGARSIRSSQSSVPSQISASSKQSYSSPTSKSKRQVVTVPVTNGAPYVDYKTPSAAVDNDDSDGPSVLSRYEMALQNKINDQINNPSSSKALVNDATREPILTNLEQKLASSRTDRGESSAISLEDRRHTRSRSVDSSSRSLDGKKVSRREIITAFQRQQQEASPFEEKKVDLTPPRTTSPRHHQRSSSEAFHIKTSDGEEKKSDSGLLDSPTVSVKDRAAMFSSTSSPRSPEAERVRISSLGTPGRSQHVRVNSLDQVASPRGSDIGDIPMMSNIKRPSAQFSRKPIQKQWGDEETSTSSLTGPIGRNSGYHY